MTPTDRTYTAVALFGGGGLYSLGMESTDFDWRGIPGGSMVGAECRPWLNGGPAPWDDGATPP